MVPVLIGSGAVAPALSLQAAALSPRKGPGVLRTPALIGGVAQLPRVRAVVQALGAQDHLALGGQLLGSLIGGRVRGLRLLQHPLRLGPGRLPRPPCLPRPGSGLAPAPPASPAPAAARPAASPEAAPLAAAGPAAAPRPGPLRVRAVGFRTLGPDGGTPALGCSPCASRLYTYPTTPPFMPAVISLN